MKIRAVIVTMLLAAGSMTLAQYGFGDPWSGSYGYTDPFGMAWPDPMQQMDVIGQQIEAELQRISQQFIDLYRQATGDYASPDSLALERGMQLHCQREPLDCQLAMQGSRRAMQDQAASFAAHQRMMQDRYAANDAAFDAWMQDQRSRDQAGSDFIRSVIREEGIYVNPASGTAYSLPFTPSAKDMYRTPDGYPLVFDAAGDTWYQLDGNGDFTPYYGQ